MIPEIYAPFDISYHHIPFRLPPRILFYFLLTHPLIIRKNITYPDCFSAEAADGSDHLDSEIAAQISQLKMAAGGAASAASSMKAGGGGVGSGKGGEEVVTASSTKITAGSSDSGGGLKEEQSQSTDRTSADAASSSSSSSLKQRETENINLLGGATAAITNTTTATMLPAPDTAPPSSPHHRPDVVHATPPASPTIPMPAGSVAISTSTPPFSLSSPAANDATMTTPTVTTSFPTNERDNSIEVNAASSDDVGVDIPPTPPSLRAVRRQVLAERALERAQRGGDGVSNHHAPSTISTVSTAASTSSSSIATGASNTAGNVTTTTTITTTTSTSSGINNEQQTSGTTGTGGNATDQSTGSRVATNVGSDSSVGVVAPAVAPVAAAAAVVAARGQGRVLILQEGFDITDNILIGLQNGLVITIAAILLRRLLIFCVVAFFW